MKSQRVCTHCLSSQIIVILRALIETTMKARIIDVVVILASIILSVTLKCFRPSLKTVQ